MNIVTYKKLASLQTFFLITLGICEFVGVTAIADPAVVSQLALLNRCEQGVDQKIDCLDLLTKVLQGCHTNSAVADICETRQTEIDRYLGLSQKFIQTPVQSNDDETHDVTFKLSRLHDFEKALGMAGSQFTVGTAVEALTNAKTEQCKILDESFKTCGALKVKPKDAKLKTTSIGVEFLSNAPQKLSEYLLTRPEVS